MKKMIFLLLMCVGIESFGEIIIIKGRDFPLEYRNGWYYLPLGVGATTLYITMDGLNKVCFLDTTAPGTLEQVSAINIFSNGVLTKWNCFPYKTTVTEANPLY